MTMNQIRKRIGKDSTFTLAQFSVDMHLIWDNARTYNEDGSWVYSAADEMQAFFDKLWEEEVPKLEMDNGSNGVGLGVPGVMSAVPSGLTSGVGSGSSTPMYKPTEPLPTKIKLNMRGGPGRSKMQPSPDEEEDEAEDSESSDSDDDDY